MMAAAFTVRWHGPVGALTARDRGQVLARATSVPADVRRAALEIVDDVARRGDAALVEHTERLDKVKLDDVRVPADALARAHGDAPREFLDAFRTCVAQVRAYHETLASVRVPRFEARGVIAYERRVPLATAGIYAPGGRAAYPSTVAMTAVPALVAGVSRIVVASPPTASGAPHALVLAACHELGLREVFAVGGAQAIGALAHGTATVPACDTVVGPGNVYVQAAKEAVAGRVRIDAPAGPSEVAALVDEHADAAVAARELVAQAEHDPATLVVAVCLGSGTDAKVLRAVEAEVARAERASIVHEALAARGAVFSARTLDEAVAFLDELAPEHCVLLHRDGARIADRLTGPACIVAGARARVALADYAAGPSHVLPTGGAARAWSGVSVDTFTRSVHVVLADRPDAALVDAGARMARLEGLPGHARALEEGTT